MMGEPPVEAGALQEMVAWVDPGVAMTEIGALGTAAGIIGGEVVAPGPVPSALVAVTVKV
jgi:hypothetical protein